MTALEAGARAVSPVRGGHNCAWPTAEPHRDDGEDPAVSPVDDVSLIYKHSFL